MKQSMKAAYYGMYQAVNLVLLPAVVVAMAMTSGNSLLFAIAGFFIGFSWTVLSISEGKDWLRRNSEKRSK